MSKKYSMLIWTVILMVFGGSMLYYMRFSITEKPIYLQANNACFDLSDSLLSKGRILQLNGPVHFFKDTFLTQDDISNRIIQESGQLDLGEDWNDFRQDQKAPRGHGFGTYHFKVNVPRNGSYALKIMDVKSAYEIIVDGVYLGGAGHVGRNRSEMQASRYQKEFYFHAEDEIVDVIIQVSNFHHRKGGLTGTMFLGKPEIIAFSKTRLIGIEMFIMSSLFILFIYHLALYVYRLTDKSILYFSLLCLVMFIRLGYIGERVFLELFSFLKWGVSIRLEYITLFLTPIFTASFIKELFPKDIPGVLVKGIHIFASVLVLGIFILSPTAFSYLPAYSLPFLTLVTLILLAYIFIAVLRKREYASVVFLGFFVYYALSLHDALYYIGAFRSVYLMPLGLFVATISQAYVLARKTSTAYYNVELLSDQLAKHAGNLENEVEIRTRELQQQKEELEKQKERTEEKAQLLRESNEQLLELDRFKKDMTSMMIHDLKAPLSSILGFADLSKKENKFSKYILSSGWEMQNLIQNILDVNKYETTEYVLKKTTNSLSDIIQVAYRSTYYMLESKQIEFHNKVPPELLIEADKDALNRVFANFFSNAAKYAGENEVLEVSAESVELNGADSVRISIYNSGEPIPPELINNLFKKYTKSNRQNKYSSYSSGIGLTFCKIAVEAHHGQIGVESGDTGVNFWFILPLKGLNPSEQKSEIVM